MRKAIVAGILILAVGGGAFAQLIDLSPLAADINTLLEGIGREVAPQLQQIALSGDVMGEAELGNFPHFSLSVIGAGVTISSGIGNFMDSPDTDWKFLLAFPEIISTALAAAPEAEQYYTMTKNVFPYPALRLGLGFGIAGGFELLVNGFAIPQMIVDSVAGLVNVPAVSSAKLDIMNVGVRVRKVLLRDEGFKPAVSAAVGYTYSSFLVGYGPFSLAEILGEPIDLTVTTLNLEGELRMSTLVHSAGMDFHVSKRLFIFTPFLKISPWLQWTTFSALTDLTATAGTESLQLIAEPEVNLSDLSVFITSGIELKLLILVLSTSVTLNLENPLLNVPKLLQTPFLELDEPVLNGLSVNLGLRLQI